MSSDRSAATQAPASWAVVFDLDGVLIDSEGVWDEARRAVVAEAGGSWRDGATREMLGMSSGEWSGYLHDQLGVDEQPEQIAQRVLERVLERYRKSLPLLPHAVTAVRSLSERWPLGLASSSNREVIDLVLERSGLREDFAVTVSSEEVEHGKPAPDVYLAALQRLGIAGGSAVAVEDSTNGLRSAAAAGMHVVAVPNREFPPSERALELAEVTLPSLAQLTPQTIARIEHGG
jgi:HAD superfamily hydrolase (TIGR01509 family)